MKCFNIPRQAYLVLLLAFVITPPAQGQLLKKLKEKVNQAVDKTVDKTVDKKANEAGVPTGDGSQQGNSGKPTNTKGGGLTNSTPPDVQQQMTDAEKAHDGGNFSDARFSLQQALMGIEIQLGRQILQSLPPKVDSLIKDTTKNIVQSSQWGWNNLTIQTVYSQQPDKQMTITIGNNVLYSGLANLYFNNSMYVQANDQTQNVKQTRVKGYKAVIQYDDSKGYTLMVQLGQSSLIVWECINFATEADVMKAANAFDIDGIKKMMGEQ